MALVRLSRPRRVVDCQPFRSRLTLLHLRSSNNNKRNRRHRNRRQNKANRHASSAPKRVRVIRAKAINARIRKNNKRNHKNDNRRQQRNNARNRRVGFGLSLFGLHFGLIAFLIVST